MPRRQSAALFEQGLLIPLQEFVEDGSSRRIGQRLIHIAHA